MSSGRDRLPAPLPLGGVAAGAAGGEVVEGDRVVAGAGHPHHVLEQRQLVAHGADLLQLLVVLDDDDLGVGVLEHVLALLGRVGLVDRHDGGADRERGEVEVGPLGAGVGEDRDLVALGDAEVDQAEGELAHRLLDLDEAALDPPLAVLELDRRGAAVHLRGSRQQVRERGRFGSPLLHGGESSGRLRRSATRSKRGAAACCSVARRSEVWKSDLSIRPWKIGTCISTHLPITSCRFMCSSSASSDGVR